MGRMIGDRCLADDLAAAGASADVRRDALAGDFNAWTGDPGALVDRAPAWVADAALVRAYAVDQAPPERAAPAKPPPRRYLPMPPTYRQRETLAVIRRMIDARIRVTPAALASSTGTASARTGPVVEDLMGLEDRGLVEILPGNPVLVVLGPRANLFPERTVARTQRSIEIERHLRDGKTPAAIAPLLEPPATPAEVYRVRAIYCTDIPRGVRTQAVGENHHKVLQIVREARAAGGEEQRGAIARTLGISRARVHQIIANAERRGELG